MTNKNKKKTKNSLGNKKQNKNAVTPTRSIEPKKKGYSIVKTVLQNQLNQTSKKKLSPIEKMKENLKSSKFRWINEQLYTTNGKVAYNMIHKDKELFDTYHEGFRNQMVKWPVVPVDLFIERLKKIKEHYEVGDFGCGDAFIYQQVKNHTIHSFDLISKHDYIIECDIAHVPLDNASLDICIYCLSLMGTNWSDFILEANRLLRDQGELWIAEVRSRFDDPSIGGDQGFIHLIETLGFKLFSKDLSNEYFGVFYFHKINEAKTSKKKKIPSLKPCIYKRR